MKLKTTLILAFLIISIIVGAVDLISFILMENIAYEQDKIFNQEYPAIINLEDMELLIQESVQEVYSYVASNDKQEKEEFYENISNFELTSIEFSNTLNVNLQDNKEESLLYGKIIDSKESLVVFSNNIFEDFEKDGTVEKNNLDSFEKNVNILKSLFEELIKFERQEILESQKEIQKTYTIAWIVISLMSAIAIALSIVFGFRISNSVSKQFKKFGSTFKMISMGKTDIAEINGYEELNQIFSKIIPIHQELQTSKIKIEKNEQIIQQQLKKLKNSEKHKNEFVQMITHELKNPLVPIKSYADLLLSDILGPLSDIQKEKIQIISDSTNSLQRLISDLSDIQRLDTNVLELHKEQHYISEIIQNSIGKLRPELEKNNISLSTNIEENIKGIFDKQRIEQVLTNLILNAIDFCSKGNGKINIQLNSENEYAKISIKDNGAGIPSDKIDKIFEQFYQVDSSMHRQYGGTGMGLSICKKIVELHGGKIWIESTLGHGTIVNISLPKIDVSFKNQKDSKEKIIKDISSEELKKDSNNADMTK